MITLGVELVIKEGRTHTVLEDRGKWRETSLHPSKPERELSHQKTGEPGLLGNPHSGMGSEPGIKKRERPTQSANTQQMRSTGESQWITALCWGCISLQENFGIQA